MSIWTFRPKATNDQLIHGHLITLKTNFNQNMRLKSANPKNYKRNANGKYF